MQPFFRRMHFGLSQRLIPHNSAHRRFDATLRQRQEDKSGNIDIRKHARKGGGAAIPANSAVGG